jgi:hypothetical protein
VTGKLEKLKWVKLPSGKVDLSCFPDFLLIGPHRTGTTWLYRNLSEHPEVLVSEPKELYFFDRLKSPADPRYRSNELEWYLQFFRGSPQRWIWKTLHHLAKYGELYRPRIRGEATASYAVIDRELIEEIAILNPRIKVIVLIRDPVERAWSHAKKDLGRRQNRAVSEIPDAEFQAFFKAPYQRKLARFAEIIDNWSACLESGNVFTGCFDDIAARPEALLEEIFRFLRIRSDLAYTRRAARQLVNRTEPTEVPERHRRFLEDWLKPEIEELHARFAVSRSCDPQSRPLRATATACGTGTEGNRP